MKIILFTAWLIIQINVCLSQRVINAVMADDHGITDDAKKAKYLIIIKKYGDTTYERLDYNFTGTIIKLANYKDALLQVLNGRFANFDNSGYLAEDGEYQNNKKEGNWYLYNDTAHAVRKYKYNSGELLSVVDLDSLAREKEKIKEDTTHQREAVYKGGDANFTRLIQKNIKVPDRTASVGSGGTTRVRFVIDTLGKPINIQIVKSVEFALDEESLRVISLGKDWIPASDKSKKLNAYREQPISVKIK